MKITWTLAYRNPRANHFKRVTNWTGTWHQAYYLAQILGVARPDLQVYYVPSAESEMDQLKRMSHEVARGEMSLKLAHSYLEDHGNILTEIGRRVRMRETGQLPKEILIQSLSPAEAQAKYENNGRPARHLI